MEKNKLNILKRKEIIITVILVLIIISILFAVIILENKSKSASAEETENLITNIQKEEQEYIDIDQLEENILIEENNNINQNTENNITNGETNKETITGTPYYIKINYGAQVVTIYKKDAKGNYTIPVKAMICSTGVATPKSGVYKIQNRWEWLRLEGYVFGHYSTQITGNILFHSVPYLEKGNLGSIEYWEYDKLGTYASAGCIRLTVADALWIFNNCEKGTKVEFYSSSNPGPLGKPSAKKISNAPGNLKNWDPTDPNPNNPWKTYKPEDDDKNNNTNTENNNQISNNEIDDNKTNTQVNEINNQVNEIGGNETVNEINTNSIQKNEIVNETTTNNITENENKIENNNNTEETSNEESIETNII